MRWAPKTETSHAVELTHESGLEFDPKYSLAPQSLGWALYRAGDWKGCIDALEKQPDYARNGDFFAAMASWHLGDPARARDRFR